MTNNPITCSEFNVKKSILLFQGKWIFSQQFFDVTNYTWFDLQQKMFM